VLNAGHAVGNHTYNHLNGWETDILPYFHNVRNCARLVQSSLFRPPYGKLTPKQTQFLARHYRIVMWDVLSGDFDQEISKDDCLNNVILSARRGSVIVFHDSLKAESRMKYALPRVLEHFAAKGYRFESLENVLAKPERKPFMAAAAMF
jgi:peptidoglycan-N-acetylglucosamine deacetylase